MPSGAPHLRRLDDSHAVRWMIDRVDHRTDHASELDRIKPPCGITRLRRQHPKPIQRKNEVRPTMARSEHIPRTDERGADVEGANHRLPFFAYGDVFAHDRRRMSNAEINEMLHAGVARRSDGLAHGNEIDFAELLLLRRRWVGDADELHERVARRDAIRECRCIECVAADGDRAGRQLPSDPLRTSARTLCPRWMSSEMRRCPM